MAQMLRQKHTGDLFIYTSALAALPEMELVVEDPAKVIAAVLAEVEDLIDPDVHVEDPVKGAAEILFDTDSDEVVSKPKRSKK